MKRLRPWFNLVGLCLLVVVTGWLVGGSQPAQAIISIASQGTTTIPYSGTVEGAPEPVFLNGVIRVTTRVVRDPDFGTPPRVLYDFDLSGVVGKGLRSGVVYKASQGDRLVRPLAATDTVEITFPIVPNRAGGILTARPAVATFTFSFDAKAGRLTRGIVSPAVTLTELPL
jgi:hypothetical protein